MNKWSILILIIALLWLGLIIYVQQHTNIQNTKPTHEERVEVVEVGESKEKEVPEQQVLLGRPMGMGKAEKEYMEKPAKQRVGKYSTTKTIQLLIKLCLLGHGFNLGMGIGALYVGSTIEVLSLLGVSGICLVLALKALHLLERE